MRIDYLDSMPKNLALTSIGSFGYKRALNIVSAPLAEGNLLVAADAQLYDGPWAVPDALRKISTVRPLQPGHGARRLLRHRHGLRGQMDGYQPDP